MGTFDVKFWNFFVQFSSETVPTRSGSSIQGAGTDTRFSAKVPEVCWRTTFQPAILIVDCFYHAKCIDNSGEYLCTYKNLCLFDCHTSELSVCQ